MYGKLTPISGGDSIPLEKHDLLVGRDEDCDIVLSFPNVSGRHCQLSRRDGRWYIQDLNSRNGVRVNGKRIGEDQQRIEPGDEIAFARNRFKLAYSHFDAAD